MIQKWRPAVEMLSWQNYGAVFSISARLAFDPTVKLQAACGAQTSSPAHRNISTTPLRGRGQRQPKSSWAPTTYHRVTALLLVLSLLVTARAGPATTPAASDRWGIRHVAEGSRQQR